VTSASSFETCLLGHSRVVAMEHPRVCVLGRCDTVHPVQHHCWLYNEVSTARGIRGRRLKEARPTRERSRSVLEGWGGGSITSGPESVLSCT